MLAYTFINISNPILTLNVIIWSIYVGLVIACAAAVRSRNLSSDIVSSLLDSGADSPENALTLAEAGLKSGRVKAALRALKDGKVLARYVKCANSEDFRTPTDKNSASAKLERAFSVRRDFKEHLGENAKFYIPEDCRITAEVRFRKKKSSARSVIFCAVLLAAVMVFISFAIPKLTEMLDDAINYLSNL